jgi:hypothetical protein
MSGSGFGVQGEAVTVDVLPNQPLFVLLSAPGDVDWAAYATSVIPRDQDEGPAPEGRAEQIARNERMFESLRSNVGVYTLWPKAKAEPAARGKPLPYFVRFRDLTDPKTVEQVSPDNLAKSFGPGVKLKALTIQITDEPVTVGIEKRFAWWAKYKNLHFDGTSTVAEDMTDKKFAAHLNSGSFSTEYLK